MSRAKRLYRPTFPGVLIPYAKKGMALFKAHLLAIESIYGPADYGVRSIVADGVQAYVV